MTTLFRYHSSRSAVLYLFISAVLVGCGGGSGSDSASSPATGNLSAGNSSSYTQPESSANSSTSYSENGFQSSQGNSQVGQNSSQHYQGSSQSLQSSSWSGPISSQSSQASSEGQVGYSSSVADEPIHYIPESEFPPRESLENPLAIPLAGAVGGGTYGLEYAFPALEQTLVASVGITHDGITDRVFVVGMTGIIDVFPNREDVQPSDVSEFLNITQRVHSDFNEQGLLGLAFDPDYASNGYFYVYYVAEGVRTQGGDWNDAVLERWQVDPANPNRALPDSPVRLLSIPQPNRYHKGGTLAFGPDGNLYLSVGDGAWAATYAGNNRGQETDNLNGTVIRIRPHTTPEGGYDIPPDNPYLQNSVVMDEIYAYGFRNPWRFDIDMRDGTLWLGDVGQQESNGEAFAFEEVNRIRVEDAGGNYGWPICEGSRNRGAMGGSNTSHLNCSTDFKAPVYAYQHNGASASIIGGVFSDSPSLPSLRHHFLFGDYNRGIVQAVNEEGEAVDVIGPGRLNHISSFGKDLSGENYVIAFNYPGQGPSGIYRIVENDLQPVEFPQTLSATGLFSDTASLTPAPGVMPYSLNADMWADGAVLQHFIALPADATIGYDVQDIWTLPPGSALVKHMAVPIDAQDSLRPVNTAILFRQTEQWTALNYQWNTAGTDATLVTGGGTVTLETFFGGQLQPMTRNIQTSAACASCHSGLQPLALRTRQLNRMTEFYYGWLNQILEWERLELFDQPVANDPLRLVDPADQNASLDDRVKVYLDTNCAHCHAVSGGLDLRLETALENAGLLHVPTTVGSARLVPFMPNESGLYLRQTSDHGRMPVGSRYTNPLAETLFYNWIRAHDAVPTGIAVSRNSLQLTTGDSTNLTASYTYANGFYADIPADEISWWSNNPSIVSVQTQEDGSARLRAEGEGSASVFVEAPGLDFTQIPVLVTELSPIVSLRIFPEAVHLQNNQQLVLLGERQDGSLEGLTRAANWTVSGSGVASISNHGLLTQNGNGEITVEARWDGLTASIPVSTHSMPGGGDPICLDSNPGGGGPGGSGNDGLYLEFDNTPNWPQVYLYHWTTVNGNNVAPNAWPGVAMQGPNSDGYRYFEVSASHLHEGAVNVIFNNGNGGTGNQTDDLPGVNQSSRYSNGSWTPLPQAPPSPPESGGSNCIYPGAGDIAIRFDNANNWSNVLIHIWSGSGGNAQHPYGGWPGSQMLGPDNDGWWYFIVEQQHLVNGAINILFNNGQGSQTGDMTAEGSVSYRNGQLEPWGSVGGAGEHRLTVLGGNTVGGGLIFRAGTLVTVEADTVYGMDFDYWSGSAAPYVVSAPTNPEVQLVMPDQPALLQSQYREAEEDIFEQARHDYANNCASCHGANGIGALFEPLNHLHDSGDYTLASLASYIDTYMPLGSEGQCTGTQPGDCAHDIAAMILANAWERQSASSKPEPRNLRLLTREEYLNSVRDLFGINFADNLMDPVPADGLTHNFNTASFLMIDNTRINGFDRVAEDVANRVISERGFFSLAEGCGSQVSCVVEKLGQRVFRRPLTGVEISAYASLYDAGDQGRTLVQGMLLSPQYLYRSEMGQQDPVSGYYRLSNYELATLLSYTFWVTTPDDQLLQAAAQSNFNIRAQVERLLDDPRSERGLRRFARGWLIRPQYGFSAVEHALAESMREETIRFVLHAIDNNEPFQHLLTADYSIVNSALAAHYGMAPVQGNGWEVRQYIDERVGLIGHGSFLASRTGTVNPSPIKRGLYVRELLMCQEFPTPAAANFDIDRQEDDTNRDAVTRHTSDPNCFACHQYIDGIGFGLEAFDSRGLIREWEQIGTGDWVPVDRSGSINSLNAPETQLQPDLATPFFSQPELAALVADSPQGAACYSRQFYRYATGRHEEAEDEATIRAYSQDLRQGGGLRDLLIDLTLNDNFVLRH